MTDKLTYENINEVHNIQSLEYLQLSVVTMSHRLFELGMNDAGRETMDLYLQLQDLKESLESLRITNLKELWDEVIKLDKNQTDWGSVDTVYNDKYHPKN